MIPAFIRRAEADQVEHLVRITPLVAAGATLGAWFVWVHVADDEAATTLNAWFGAFVAISMARVMITLVLWRQLPSQASQPAWLIGLFFGSLAHATCWLVLATLLPGPGDAAAETIVHVVVAAMAMGATMHLASFYPLLVIYVLLVQLPLVVRDLQIGGSEHLTLALMGLMIAAYSLLSSGGQARALAKMLAQRRQHAALILALEKENRAAIEARVQAERANASKLRLFAAVNHDLRQPLHAASLINGSLIHARSIEEVQPLARRIGTCIDSLGELVDAMLDLSQFDGDRIQPEISRFALTDLMEEVVIANEPQAIAKGLALCADVTPCWVQSDRKMVLRVLSNLVGNAVRYTAVGEVRLRVDARADRVTLSVCDSGPGIPSQELPRIFDEFYQLGNPGRARQQGLGLGLATSRRISDRLGLGLSVRSRVGEGSTFSFTLPVIEAATPAKDHRSGECAVPRSGVRRVLVVEDDDASREALVLTLQRFGAGLDIVAVNSAADALVRVEGGFVPDLVITDLRLGPGPDGMALIGEVRQRLGYPVSAVVVSGDVVGNAVLRGGPEGVVLLRKPIKGAHLRSLLESDLSRMIQNGDGPSAGAQQHDRILQGGEVTRSA